MSKSNNTMSFNQYSPYRDCQESRVIAEIEGFYLSGRPAPFAVKQVQQPIYYQGYPQIYPNQFIMSPNCFVCGEDHPKGIHKCACGAVDAHKPEHCPHRHVRRH